MRASLSFCFLPGRCVRQPITVQNGTELNRLSTFGPQLDFTLVIVRRFFRAESIYKRSNFVSVFILGLLELQRGKMTSLKIALFLVTILQTPRYDVFADSSSVPPSAASPTSTIVWERRINASLWLLQNKACKFFMSNGNCTELRSRTRDAMNLYMASADEGKLVALSPDKIKLVPTSYEAVLVLDPYPEASLGHPILVFFIEHSRTRTDCTNNRKSTFTDDNECVTIAQKSRRCTNRLHDRRRKRRCDINFVPSVFTKANRHGPQLLECKSKIAGFADCPTSLTVHPLNEKCLNTKRCAITPKNIRQRHCTASCDYAVLLSGGWNRFTATTKSKDNIKMMWRYLRKNHFKHENIVTFVGNRYSIELDGNPKTKDSVPAEDEFKIRNQIKNLCSSSCVDSLVIYLNKPTKSNGAILIWDGNNDGFAEESERYEINEFFEDLRDCKAKLVTVLADQSFSGLLLEKFGSARRHTSRGTLKNVVFVVAASSDGYSTRGSFTEKWVRYSLPRQNRQRCLRNVIQDMKSLRTNQFQVDYDSSSQSLLDKTIYGGSCDQSLHVSRREMGCRFLSRKDRYLYRIRG